MTWRHKSELVCVTLFWRRWPFWRLAFSATIFVGNRLILGQTCNDRWPLNAAMQYCRNLPYFKLIICTNISRNPFKTETRSKYCLFCAFRKIYNTSLTSVDINSYNNCVCIDGMFSMVLRFGLGERREDWALIFSDFLSVIFCQHRRIRHNEDIITN